MRLGIVLAATGAAVTAWAVAAAQDGFESRGYRPADPTVGRTIHYFSRNGATSRRSAPNHPAPVPGVRNYYDQLFAEPGGGEPTGPGVRTAGGSDADSSSLINADYDRQPGRPAAGTIQPLGGQRPILRSPAPSQQPVRTVSAEETNPFLQEAAEPDVGQPEAAEQAPISDPMFGASEAAEPASSDMIPPEPAASAEPFAAAPARSTQPASRRRFPAVPTLPAPRMQQTSASEMPPAAEPMSRLAETSMGGPAAVEVRWEKVSEITVGRECRCELVVKNTGAGAAGEVAVEAYFPRSVRLTAADPKPVSAADHLTWNIPALAAGAEHRINVTLIPSEQGDMQVSAYVRYTEAAATTLAVREPMLRVTVSGPPEVAMGETVPQTITVTNPGNGTADDVVVEVNLPQGLEHAKGSRLSMPIGSLAPGQSHDVRLALFATQGGPQEVQVRATAGDTLRQDAACTVLVVAPSLSVVAEGPGLRYVGRDAVYRVKVTNDGAAAANNVRVTQAVADGFTFLRADNGGQFEAGQSQVVWYLGSIAAGQTVELAAELTAAKLGSHQHVVTVFGEGGAKAEAVIETAVDGTASLVCEIIDLDDPVEVGSETAYEIRVRNEGTKAATTVAVSCQVPAGVAALSARGPTEPRGENGMLAFPPIQTLEPGKTALYRVVVKGTTEGKHRFRVRLEADDMEPLIHEELTHYYAD
jgi:uncharacterized repeat protein (TIGR01451 family)